MMYSYIIHPELSIVLTQSGPNLTVIGTANGTRRAARQIMVTADNGDFLYLRYRNFIPLELLHRNVKLA